MRFSTYPLKTLREAPAGIETINHALMIRAGMLRYVGPGIFTYDHFLTRVVQKIEKIVREEMDLSGAVEVTLPILQPQGLWEQTKRWADYLASQTMLTTTDRRGYIYGLAPTAEEVVTVMAKSLTESWRQLPFTLYQIRTKFRNELNLRGGLVRGCEFLMKDAYSFDTDQAGLNQSYESQRRAYERIFTRCGLSFLQVEADSGAIGGSSSHEFMVVTPSGEDKVITCDSCDYKANLERAEAIILPPEIEDELRDCHEEDTPDARTVDDLVALFDLPPTRLVKTILYSVTYEDGRKETVAILMRGDREINEVKLSNHLGGVLDLTTANPETVQETTGAEVGFAGPIGLNIRIIADNTVRSLRNFLCGANKTGVHILDVNYGRDFKEPPFVDLVNAEERDQCPRCNHGKLRVTRGIEVGHLFKLGTKYSEPLGAVYPDEKGVTHPIVMGCYGIGVTRIAAAAVEISHDKYGIIWPFSIAPYEVVLITAGGNPKVEDVVAEQLYQGLRQSEVETILDDRQVRIGVKLNDADLLGFPYKIIIGKSLQQGVVDIKNRRSGETQSVPVQEAVEKINAIIEERRKNV
jgi:prolyl-tRNA synthetase